MSKIGVVHVRGVWPFHSNRAMWWPVNGPMHIDPELDFPAQHFHIDARYIPPKRWDRLLKAMEGEIVSIRQKNHYTESYSLEKAAYHRLAGAPLMTELIAPQSLGTTIISHLKKNGLATYDPLDNSRQAVDVLKAFPEHEWKKVRTVEEFRPMQPVPGLSVTRSKLKRWHNVPLDLEKMVCPHRGADLSGIEPEDGLITCPARPSFLCQDGPCHEYMKQTTTRR